MSVQLGFGDFELDEGRFELRQRGRAVSIQPKVLDLIFYLAKNRDRVVSKEELLETVWKGVVVTEASLSQAVSLARRALGDSPDSQHSIRTVRSKGLQFVAAEIRPNAPEARVAKPAARAGSTMMETALDAEPRRSEPSQAAHLFAVCHGETPTDGGAGWSLAAVDEVRIVRGSQRRSERTSGLAPLCTIFVPGRLMSRRHARLVRTTNEWFVIDEGSRNGTFVNGERIDKRALDPGDVLECGRSLFLFSEELVVDEVEADVDSRASRDGILATVTPRWIALERDLRRIAGSDLPVLLVGESGVGKTHVAQTLHRLSSRRGPMVQLDTEAPVNGEIFAAFDRARHGTLLIENLERVANMPRLASALERAPEVRLICTSMTSMQDLEERVPADLLMRVSGYRCELPPLRERRGDLGAIVGGVLEAHAPALELDVAAARALVRHRWPGNVRELVHVLKAAATLAGDKPVQVDHLPPEMRG